MPPNVAGGVLAIAPGRASIAVRPPGLENIATRTL